jgi:virginiamycin B lyase
MTKRILCTIGTVSFGACLPLMLLLGQDAPAPPAAEKKERPKRVPRPGVSIAGVKREMTTLTPAAVFSVPGTPDWQVITEDAVWVSNGPKNTVHRLDPKTNHVVAAIEVGKRPCSGLASGFGSVWVPVCGDRPQTENGARPALVRIDIKTNQLTATIAVGPANSEGGLVAGPEAVWMVTDPKGTLSRIDPATNRVAAEIAVAPGSVACVYAEGAVWVSSPEKSVITRVDPQSEKVVQQFYGEGSGFLLTTPNSLWLADAAGGLVQFDTRRIAATTWLVFGSSR